MAEGPRTSKGNVFKIAGSYAITPSDPIEVGSEHQLLMDRYVVDDIWDCRRTVHQPDKHPENPLIRPDKRWEGIGPGNGCSWFDPETGLIRMWASAHHRQHYISEKSHKTGLGVYYESEDGVHWSRPNLRLVEFDGDTDNNIFWEHPDILMASISVVPLPERMRDRGRYVMLGGVAVMDPPPPPGDHSMTQRIFYSDDGLSFTEAPENPIFKGRSDCHNNIVYNPERDVFMHYRRATVNANEIRRIAFSEIPDLIHWTQPVGVIGPDELDPACFYGMPVVRYRGAYLGFLQMFHWHPDIKLPKDFSIDVQLAWSRDGIHWERHPERPVFLPTGRIPDFDWGMVLVQQGFVEHEGQIYIYYSAHERLHNGRMQPDDTCIGLGTLRSDGFVSLDAPKAGYMLTKPVRCPGGKLRVNTRTSGKGCVKVAIRDGNGERDGQWLEDWGYDNNVPFSGDSIDGEVDWKTQPTLDTLKGRAIRLHFWLEEAELYSFWFE